jgi:carbonic anhydrase/acetyltransferase-like protein (isoleucine patch superfamily)
LIEFDLVEVGDESCFNEESVLQSHLFEDRVLKASTLRVGRRCGVGAGSVVLYDTEMEDGAQLGALSLLMKGETLPAGTVWAGSPAAWHDRTGLGVAKPRTANVRRLRTRPGSTDDERAPYPALA